MKKILLLGAGRSSGSLIAYLLQHAPQDGFKLRVGDRSPELAAEKTGEHPFAEAFAFDIENTEQRELEISSADIVISMLPPALHILAANDCLRFSKNLVTASYVSPELYAMNDEVKSKGLLFLNECGLDPGIDHMSAMEIIHRLKQCGAHLTAFRSYTGGLVAPESNDNPWGYKFTWNPRNVILAGQGTAKYIQNGKYHYTPYNRLFNEIVRIEVEGNGRYDGYANRDSLAYRKHYGIDDIPTIIRGTLRNEGYCSAWQVFVLLGITDDSFIVEDSEHLSYAQFVESFIPLSCTGSDLEERIARFCNIDPDGPAMAKIRYTGILENVKIGLIRATPAQILQHLLEPKWKLKENDKDMIVMQHQFEYTINNIPHKLISSLVVKGEDTRQTAMAKTVGLPLGIAARLILNKQIKVTGVFLPVMEEVYIPVLKELESLGIKFEEKIIVAEQRK
jgi:saccharopine dehydrogenase-like NADP-dependent oxidoreductase